MIEVPCRAKDPRECKYHSAALRAEEALRIGNRDAYLVAMDEMRAAINTTPEIIDLFANQAALLARERAAKTPQAKVAAPKLEPEIIESLQTVLARRARIEKLAYALKVEQLQSWESESDLEYRRTVDVDFGSAGYEIDPTYVCAQTESIFLHGFCVLLAHEMQSRSGLPVALFTESEHPVYGWQGHAGVLLDDETFVDVTGKRNIAMYMDAHKGIKFETVGRAELVARTVDPEFAARPLSFLAEFEGLITEQTAVETLRHVGVLKF